MRVALLTLVLATPAHPGSRIPHRFHTGPPARAAHAHATPTGPERIRPSTRACTRCHTSLDHHSWIPGFLAAEAAEADAFARPHPWPAAILFGASTSKSLTASTASIMMGLPFAAGAA
jgi:hypothetical protein